MSIKKVSGDCDRGEIRLLDDFLAAQGQKFISMIKKIVLDTFEMGEIR
jgi:hypothetical protein